MLSFGPLQPNQNLIFMEWLLPHPAFFYSSLLPVLWLWLYGISLLCLFFAIRVDRLESSLSVILNLDEAPGHCIAMMALVLLTLAGLISAAVLLIIRSAA
jgi:hypothetical protein